MMIWVPVSETVVAVNVAGLLIVIELGLSMETISVFAGMPDPVINIPTTIPTVVDTVVIDAFPLAVFPVKVITGWR